MSNFVKKSFDSKLSLDQQLANDVAALLTKAISEKGKALLVVSGGSTPLQFFTLLSRKKLSWKDVTITLADERWVPATDNDSNEKLLRQTLLVNAANVAQFVTLKNPANKAVNGETICNQQLSGLGTFDVVILGMGGDGHTASLFPKAKNLALGLDMNSGKHCIAIDPVTAPHTRMSMTLPRLLNAKQIFIHITGAEKQAVIETATQAEDQKLLPISSILQQQHTPVVLYWAG